MRVLTKFPSWTGGVGSRFGLTGWLRGWGVSIWSCCCRFASRSSRRLLLLVVSNPLNHPARSGHPSCPGGEFSLNSPPGQEGWQPLWADGVVEMLGNAHVSGTHVVGVWRAWDCTWCLNHSTTPPEAGTPPVQEGSFRLVPLLDRRGGSRFGLTGWMLAVRT